MKVIRNIAARRLKPLGLAAVALMAVSSLGAALADVGVLQYQLVNHTARTVDELRLKETGTDLEDENYLKGEVGPGGKAKVELPGVDDSECKRRTWVHFTDGSKVAGVIDYCNEGNRLHVYDRTVKMN